MTIRLLRHTLSFEGTEHVDVAPRYLRPESPDGYWHSPRAVQIDSDRHPSIPVLVRVMILCSHSWRLTRAENLTDDRPPAMVCASCDGRAQIAEVSPYRDGPGADLVYRPRSEFHVPKVCPFWEWDAEWDGPPNKETCPVCGARARYTRDYCGWRPRPHDAGERLASYAPCDVHGWAHLKPAGKTLVCADSIGHGRWRRRCEYTLRPATPMVLVSMTGV